MGSACGHLPEFVARRVRSGLPPPPPSLVGARTPGSLGAHSRFSLCFWGDCTALGRAAKEVRRVRGEVVAGVPQIVSRARFRGPGCARVSPPRGRRTSDWAWARPNTVPLPVRRCADGSWILLDPSYVPEYPGSKLLIAGIQAGWLGEQAFLVVLINTNEVWTRLPFTDLGPHLFRSVQLPRGVSRWG